MSEQQTSSTSVEQQELYFKVWSKAVDTQMHFNEMSVRSRQFGLAFVAAALGLAIVLVSQGKDFAFHVPCFGGFEVHATVLIILASMLAMWGVRILDLTVYHRMLRGAVSFGEDLEEQWLKTAIGLNAGMTQSISHFSRFEDASIFSNGGPYTYLGEKKFSAELKIRRFYTFCLVSLGASAAVLFFLTAKVGMPPVREGQEIGKPETMGASLPASAAENLCAVCKAQPKQSLIEQKLKTTVQSISTERERRERGAN